MNIIPTMRGTGALGAIAYAAGWRCIPGARSARPIRWTYTNPKRRLPASAITGTPPSEFETVAACGGSMPAARKLVSYAR